MIECQYELTDRLAFYVSGRKPDHNSGQHWIIPEMADSLDVSDLAKEARAKLQSLPNHLFEDLACDVFDEVRHKENIVGCIEYKVSLTRKNVEFSKLHVLIW